MNIPYLKYYLSVNPNYGNPKPEFIPPTRKEYAEYLEQDSGGICSHGPGSNHIKSYELYVERAEQNYNIGVDCPTVINQIEMSGDEIRDSKIMKTIEQKDGFIRWMEK
jgi:hypothetical protein